MSAIHGKRFLYVFLASVFFSCLIVPARQVYAGSFIESIKDSWIGTYKISSYNEGPDIPPGHEGSISGSKASISMKYNDNNTGKYFSMFYGKWACSVKMFLRSETDNSAVFSLHTINKDRGASCIDKGDVVLTKMASNKLRYEYSESSYSSRLRRRYYRNFYGILTCKSCNLDDSPPRPEPPNPTPPPVEVPVQPTISAPTLSLPQSNPATPNRVHLACNEPAIVNMSHTDGLWNSYVNGKLQGKKSALSTTYQLARCNQSWTVYFEDPEDKNNRSNTIEIFWAEKISVPLPSLSVQDQVFHTPVHLQCDQTLRIDFDHIKGLWDIYQNGSKTHSKYNLEEYYTIKKCGERWTFYLEDPYDSSNRINAVEVVWADKIIPPTLPPKLSLSKKDPDTSSTVHLQCREPVTIKLSHTEEEWDINFNGEVQDKNRNRKLDEKYDVSDCESEWTIYLQDPKDPSIQSNTIHIVWEKRIIEDKVVLLLHGTASGATTWDSLVDKMKITPDDFILGGDPLKTDCPIISHSPNSNQISVQDVRSGEKPEWTVNGDVYCYRVQFGYFDIPGFAPGLAIFSEDLSRIKCINRSRGCSGDFSSFSQLGEEVNTAINYITRIHGKNTEIILVGHSRGGISGRAFLQNSEFDRFRVVGLLTIGTPHTGTELGLLHEYLRSCEQRRQFGDCKNDWLLAKSLHDLSRDDDQSPFDNDNTLEYFDVRRPTFGFQAPGSDHLNEFNSMIMNLPNIDYSIMAYNTIALGDLLGTPWWAPDLKFSIFKGLSTNNIPRLSQLGRSAVLGDKTPEYFSGDGTVPYSRQHISNVSKWNTLGYTEHKPKVKHGTLHVYETQKTNDIKDALKAMYKRIEWR